MPTNKSAFKRYLVIIRTLRDTGYDNPVSQKGIIDAIANEIGIRVSESTIDKDIDTLRNDSDFGFMIPIRSRSGGRSRNGGYYFDSAFSLSDEIKKRWKI